MLVHDYGNNSLRRGKTDKKDAVKPVSYTHLDVYKRQSQSYMVRAPWYMLTCGSVIVLLILGVSLIGEGLQQKKWGR